MRLEGGVRSIETDFGLPSDLDAVFQWYTDGRIYFIKGSYSLEFTFLYMLIHKATKQTLQNISGVHFDILC